jgi:uncharacterized protein (TIGR03084 family)
VETESDPVLRALADQHAELDALLAGLDGADWDAASPCEGWTVADVVLHLAQTDEMAVASVHGELQQVMAELTLGLAPASSIDDGVAAMVSAERGAPGPVVLDRWRDASAALRGALHGCEPATRVMWVAGELSARTLATTRLAESWIHTGDVATALGVPVGPTDRLWHIARLAWRTLPYAFTLDGREPPGPVAFELTGPAGEPWHFRPEQDAPTVIRGDALELCLVAGRRVDPTATSLRGEGPDAGAVLALVRTYA